MRLMLLEDLPGVCSRAFSSSSSKVNTVNPKRRASSETYPLSQGSALDTTLGPLPLLEILYWANLYDKFNRKSPRVRHATQVCRDRLKRLEAALEDERIGDDSGGSNRVLATGAREFGCLVSSRFKSVAVELEALWTIEMNAIGNPPDQIPTGMPCTIHPKGVGCTCNGAAIARTVHGWEASPAASQQCVLISAVHQHYSLLREAFQMVDQDRSGGINAEEVTNLLSALGKDPGPALGKAILASGDENGDGSIDFLEFIGWEERLPGRLSHQLSEFKELFGMFDTDGGGSLGPREIQTAMKLLGIPGVSEASARVMGREAGGGETTD